MSVHLNSNPIKLLNHPAIKPDVGCCAKFGAFIIASAGVAGLATAAFGGPIASSALAGTVGKAAAASGIIEGLKTGRDMLACAGAAAAGNQVTTSSHDTYIYMKCTSPFNPPLCIVPVLCGVAGGALVLFAVWGLYKISSHCVSKYN